MRKIQSLIHKYVFSDELALYARMINMIYLVGMVSSFAAMVTRIATGGNIYLVLIIFLIFCTITATMVICNRFKLYKVCTVITILIMCDILFPLSFYAMGGLHSAMPAYFVLSIMLIFLLIQGWLRVFLLISHILIAVFCYASTFIPFFQQFIEPTEEGAALVVDHVQSFVVVGLCVGVIAVFQYRIYVEEKAKSDMARETLAAQDRLLQTVNKMAETLLASDAEHLKTTLMRAMETMSNCIDADRMYIWKRQVKDGKPIYFQEYEWVRPGVSLKATLHSVSGSPYLEGIEQWEEVFAQGGCVNGPVESLSATEQKWLAPYGIVSILVFPIYLQDQFWGFVSFDDCTRTRYFAENQIDILHSGSLMISSAVVRREITAELIQAREDALSSSKAKGDFLSNMSHEMRTPMNAIIGMTSIGRDAPGIERKNYAFDKIDDASTHLLGVINDILDMSKIEANKFELSLTDFNFERMLRKTADVINFRVEEKRQRFTVHIDSHIPHSVIGDEQRMAQVVANLLSNAVKFTPEEKSIHLEATLLEEDDNYCSIRVEVRDTGIGISEEQKQRLFTSFEQAESSTSRKFGGTGLGLAISKRIIEMMGGEIAVRSTLGKGSSFAFTLWMKRGQKAHQNLLTADINWSNVRILAVDDDESVGAYFAEIAKRFGIALDNAVSGQQALALMDTKGFYDMYFVDWKMPEMNGIDLAQKIKERDGGKSVIIMISSSEWSEIEGDAEAVGVSKFLPKPLFPSAIADLINECLSVGAVHAATKTDGKDVQTFPGRCLLLAEDVEINREILLTLLEPTELEIRCAENGREAVRMFQEDPAAYDLIFMDVQMPEMDGYEATQMIRAMDDPKGARIPIVAMTANVFKEDVERCIEAGMNDHLGKPMDFEDMMQVLRRYLV